MAFNVLPKTNEISPDATVTFPLDLVQGVLTGDWMFSDTSGKYIEQAGKAQTVTSTNILLRSDGQPYLYKVGDTYILVGMYSSQIYYSKDLKIWTHVTDSKLYDPSGMMGMGGGYTQTRPTVSNGTLYLIVYFMSPYGSLQRVGNVLFKTTDGITWTEVSLPSYVTNMFSVVANGNKIIVSSTDMMGMSPVVYESSDGGTSWTSRYVPFMTYSFNLFYVDGLYIAAGHDSMAPGVWVSTDAVSWTMRTHPMFGQLFITSNNVLVDGDYVYFAQNMILLKMKISDATTSGAEAVSLVGYVYTGMYQDRGTIIKIGSNMGYLARQDKTVNKVEASSAPMGWTSLFSASSAGNGYLAVTTGSTTKTENVVSLLSTLYQK